MIRASTRCRNTSSPPAASSAVAPDVVLTVRMYGTRPLYGPRLVRKFSFTKLRTRRSETRDTGQGQIVAQVRAADVVPSCCTALQRHISNAEHGSARPYGGRQWLHAWLPNRTSPPRFPGWPWVVADFKTATKSACTCPRSLMSRRFCRAHARTATVSTGLGLAPPARAGPACRPADLVGVVDVLAQLGAQGTSVVPVAAVGC
jgi:hypothetical protein